MELSRRILQRTGFAAIAFLVPLGGADEHLPPPEHAEVAGMHWWLIEIPNDLVAGEFLSTCWTYPSVDGKPSQQEETGLDFEDVPTGTTAKLFLWFEPWLKQKGKGMDGMKFCVKYREEGGASKERYGILRIPAGYIDLHAYASLGERTDGAWILMMTNPRNDPDRSSVVLDFHYVLPDSGKKTQKINGSEPRAAEQPATRPLSK